MTFPVTAFPNHLDGSKSYLTTNDIFTFMGVRFHNHFKKLICLCGIAQLPSATVTHIHHHGIQLTKPQILAFGEIVKELGITDNHEVTKPPPGGPPIELLDQVTDGFCCNHCTFCGPKKKSFDNHWYKNHKDLTILPGYRHHLGTLQTFFRPVGECYFEVNPLLSELSSDDMFVIYMRDEVSNFPVFPATAPAHAHEVPPMLQLTQWHIHLQDYSKDYRTRGHLLSLVTLPTHILKKGLGHLGDIVTNYLKDIRAKAINTTVAMRCLLMECPRYVTSTNHTCLQQRILICFNLCFVTESHRIASTGNLTAMTRLSIVMVNRCMHWLKPYC
jgi:Orsellinic acid/F9775 biosynthesis cluster protein D